MPHPKHRFICECGWVFEGKATVKSAKARGSCSAGCWSGKGGDHAGAAKPTQKQPPTPQQGFSPAFNAWLDPKATDAKDDQMDDGCSTQSVAYDVGSGAEAGVTEAEAAALKLEGLRDDEACCKAQIEAAKLQKGPLAIDVLKIAEELLSTIQCDIRMAKPAHKRLKELQKAEREAVKARDDVISKTSSVKEAVRTAFITFE